MVSKVPDIIASFADRDAILPIASMSWSLSGNTFVIRPFSDQRLEASELFRGKGEGAGWD